MTPMPGWASALLAAVTAGLLTVPLVPLASRLAHRLGSVDPPGGRRSHDGDIPRLGGVAIVVAATAAIALVVVLSPEARILHPLQASFLVAATLIVFGLGLVDDIVGTTVARKFVVQTIAAGMVVALGLRFDSLQLPFAGRLELGLGGPLVSILWIVGITNAINLIDGLDGLAAGVAGIIAASFTALALLRGGDLLTVVVAAAFGGASLLFLRSNWAPARVFMGDSGSLTLGFVLAVLSVHSSLKASAAVAVFVPLLALGLPAIDTLAVMAARYLRSPRRGLLRRLAAMFEADRSHLHHVLASAARGRVRIVVGLYALVAASCLMALVVALSGSPRLGLVCLAVELAAVALIRLTAARREKPWSETPRAEPRSRPRRDAPRFEEIRAMTESRLRE